jgi:Domain of unknown function (DUF3885)
VLKTRPQASAYFVLRRDGITVARGVCRWAPYSGASSDQKGALPENVEYFAIALECAWYRSPGRHKPSRGLLSSRGAYEPVNFSQERDTAGSPWFVVYPLWMERYAPFNLPEFMFSHFNRVDFGGELFQQWPVGIRFEIGIEQVSRAAKLFDFAFAKAEHCILVSQDCIEGTEIVRSATPLFGTPGIFPGEPSQFQSVDVSPFEEAEYRLTWTRLSPLAFDPARMFQAIANREQEGDPKVASAVYVIDPRSKVIMHMYDDRGLDVIATKLNTLRPLFESFTEWILDNQRHRIEFRFRTNSKELLE